MSSSSSSSSSAGPSHAIPVPNAVVEEEVDIFDVYSASACLTLDNPNQRNEYVYFEKPQASFLRLSSLFDENHIHEGKTISVLAVSISLPPTY